MERLIRRLVVTTATALFAVSGAAVPSALADGVYHTERLELSPIAGSETGSGMVVNIHANGPVIGAQERYLLIGALPDTDYVVWLIVGGADFMPTATIHTNRNGNGHAKATISAEDLAPFSGAVLPVRWALRVGGVDAYTTDVTTVTLD